jgi:hypothetical protein
MHTIDFQSHQKDKECEDACKEATLQVVLAALEAFVAADSWSEAQCVVEAHSRELLTDVADDVLVTMIARYEDNDVVRMLTQHREVLMRCRVVGINAAFVELAAATALCPEDVDPALWERALRIDTSTAMMDFLAEHPDLIPPVYQRLSHIMGELDISLLDGILGLLEVDTWSAAREIVEGLPAILSLEADIWLLHYGASLARAGNRRAAAVVQMRRWLLARCRMIGVAKAFGSRLAQWDGVQVGKAAIPTHHWMLKNVAQA